MSEWVDAGSEEDVRSRGRRVFRSGGKQILLLVAGGRVLACNNRCPHEGYPLSEGTLDDGCTLTCNWHNWKFNLGNGETLVGGDRLRTYPVEVRDGRVRVDIADAPPAGRQARALENLAEAIADDDHPRMAREVARYLKAGGDPLEPLRQSIISRVDRLEYGMTHAFAASPDWISLHRNAPDDAHSLAALVEPLAHLAWDTLREERYPFAEGLLPWSAPGFVAAIEREDEQEATRLLRGALDAAVPLAGLRHAFATAALAHYQDFGHSAIYTLKAFQLIAIAGPAITAPVLLSLLRSLVYARREDRIPEFRAYAGALATWGTLAPEPCTPEALPGLPVTRVLQRVSAMAGSPEERYRALLAAGAIAMLRFDMSAQDQVDKPVSHNVSWLDFTHMLTFANAVRILCTAHPELWPQGLLQMGCFLGRNAPFLQPEPDDAWFVADHDAFLAGARASLYDHGISDPIYACHRVKMTEAVGEEMAWAGPTHLRTLLAAALNRYLGTGIRYRHVLRTARQSLAFVEAEG